MCSSVVEDAGFSCLNPNDGNTDVLSGSAYMKSLKSVLAGVTQLSGLPFFKELGGG